MIKCPLLIHNYYITRGGLMAVNNTNDSEYLNHSTGETSVSSTQNRQNSQNWPSTEQQFNVDTTSEIDDEVEGPTSVVSPTGQQVTKAPSKLQLGSSSQLQANLRNVGISIAVVTLGLAAIATGFAVSFFAAGVLFPLMIAGIGLTLAGVAAAFVNLFKANKESKKIAEHIKTLKDEKKNLVKENDNLKKVNLVNKNLLNEFVQNKNNNVNAVSATIPVKPKQAQSVVSLAPTVTPTSGSPKDITNQSIPLPPPAPDLDDASAGIPPAPDLEFDAESPPQTSSATPPKKVAGGLLAQIAAGTKLKKVELSPDKDNSKEAGEIKSQSGHEQQLELKVKIKRAQLASKNIAAHMKKKEFKEALKCAIEAKASYPVTAYAEFEKKFQEKYTKVKVNVQEYLQQKIKEKLVDDAKAAYPAIIAAMENANKQIQEATAVIIEITNKSQEVANNEAKSQYLVHKADSRSTTIAKLLRDIKGVVDLVTPVAHNMQLEVQEANLRLNKLDEGMDAGNKLNIINDVNVKVAIIAKHYSDIMQANTNTDKNIKQLSEQMKKSVTSPSAGRSSLFGGAGLSPEQKAVIAARRSQIDSDSGFDSDDDLVIRKF
jgi:hypothetical protein